MKVIEDKILVSIIVPAYNVEKYIGQCIESLIEQSYQNIEIIVVNDGSTDNTKSIIESYVDTNSNVLVINCENRGVSHARNLALDMASGEYVTFIDADDFLAKDAIEYLIELVFKTGANLCFSKNCFSSIRDKQIVDDKIGKISSEDAIELLISPKIIVGCWNKIYRVSFLRENNIKFSENLFYGEGLNFIINAAQMSRIVGVGCRKIYYYRRNNLTSATTSFNICKFRNGEKALLRIKASTNNSSNKINNMFDLHMSLFCLGAIVGIINSKNKKKYELDYLHWREVLFKNTKKVLKYNNVSMYRKLMLVIGCLNPTLISKLDLYRRKNIQKNSVTNFNLIEIKGTK